MQGCKRAAGIATLLLAGLGCGCQTGGLRSSLSGPSPQFGWVPPQSEPPIEDSAGSPRAARASQTADVDDVDSSSSAPKGKRLAGLIPGRDKEPPQRRTLPISSDRAAAVDDGEIDPE